MSTGAEDAQPAAAPFPIEAAAVVAVGIAPAEQTRPATSWSHAVPDEHRAATSLAEASAAKLLRKLVEVATAATDPRQRLHDLTAVDRMIADRGGVSWQLREARAHAIRDLQAAGATVPEIAQMIGVRPGRVYAILAGNPAYGRRAPAEWHDAEASTVQVAEDARAAGSGK
jgi:predicted trehalose synthase